MMRNESLRFWYTVRKGGRNAATHRFTTLSMTRHRGGAYMDLQKPLQSAR